MSRHVLLGLARELLADAQERKLMREALKQIEAGGLGIDGMKKVASDALHEADEIAHSVLEM